MTKQATWKLVNRNGDTIASVMNSHEPLSIQQWQERIERSIADAVDVGSYDVEVCFCELLRLSWHVEVKRVAVITPF